MGALFVGGGHYGVHVLDDPVEVGALDVDGGGVVGDGGLQGLDVGGAALGGDHGDGDLAALAVGFHHPDHLGVDGAGEDHGALFALLAHEYRFGGGGSAVVHRGVGHVHAGELAHLGLILENGLVHALADLSLVGRVGRQELLLGGDGLHDGGDKVAVSSGPPENALEGPVLLGQAGHDPAHLQLAQALGQIQVLDPDGLGDHVIELVDGGQADGLEHGLPLFPRGGNVAGHGVTPPQRPRRPRRRRRPAAPRCR